MNSVSRMKGSCGTVTDNVKKLLCTLERFKYPILILVIGIFLLLLPTGASGSGPSGTTESESMAQILSSTKGVGDTKVLISDNGVVVVCRGADRAAVRLEIIRAVGSYTGYSSDKITILKMAD